MAHLIKNFRSLAITPLRKDALMILEAGLKAVETPSALCRSVRLQGEKLIVGRQTYDLRRYRRVFVVAIGKAAFSASKTLETILGKRLTDGIALDVRRGKLKRMASREGSHPLPSMENMKATGEIVALLKDAGAGDLVIAVISGGGSALLCWPTELSCLDMRLLTQTLMSRGATIEEMNTLRKHTSDVFGGQLAALAAPAEVIGLIFSDVPGDDLSVVASGPTVLDLTTIADAKEVLQKYDVLKVCRLPNCNLKETPKDPKIFDRVYNVLVVSNRHALQAMKQEAGRLGYRPRVLSSTISGEASEVGKRLVSRAKPGQALLAAGETTVTVRQHGVGGRNQECVLGALTGVSSESLFISCASDGIDNTPSAGAIADTQTLAHAKAKKVNPAVALTKNASFAFFRSTGDQIVTGKLDRNVSDLFLTLGSKKS